MKTILKNATLLIAALAVTVGCARNLKGDTYTSSNTVGKVVYGTIVSARPVVLKDAKQLQDNVLGGAAGGVVGGIAGSGMGGGSGQGLATAGGAIAGALLGAYIQDELGTQQGYEYIVKLDSPRYQGDIGSSKKSVTIKGQNSVSQDIKDSIHTTETESSAISVAQADDVMLQAGTRVMVVYNDDRPRVVPAN